MVAPPKAEKVADGALLSELRKQGRDVDCEQGRKQSSQLALALFYRQRARAKERSAFRQLGKVLMDVFGHGLGIGAWRQGLP